MNPARPRPQRYEAIRLRPAEPAASFAEWKGIWVIAEHRGGRFHDVTLELLGAAGPMAEKLHQKVTAILLGHETSDLAGQLLAAGADG
ncbi:MAG TPA: hypothetical protein VI796_04105, partial [Candidatus Thermoplasmatota archaeon]|nr:hypothetical protein [Candidatus Thermoplasmatota archaeon]